MLDVICLTSIQKVIFMLGHEEQTQLSAQITTDRDQAMTHGPAQLLLSWSIKTTVESESWQKISLWLWWAQRD